MTVSFRETEPSDRQEPLDHPGPVTSVAVAAVPRPGRDRYLDLLRAIALVRVIVYHTFGWAWLTVVFPSMGVMFALAGSLMARSLQRPALAVLRGRARRLLLPLWLYGVVVLGVLFTYGWGPGKDEKVWWWLRLACWVVPVGTPPYPEHFARPGGLLDSTWAEQAAGPLWYLRAYFWFVLLSPLLLKAFRRLPWVTLAAPIALTAVVGTGLVGIPGDIGAVVTDFATYGSCWVLGFAHHDGLLRRMPPYLALCIAQPLMGLALWWTTKHPSEYGWDLNEIPLSQALWSFAACLLLLRVSPSWRELPGRLRGLDRPVTLASNRAVTIYLWHQSALMFSVPLTDQLWKLSGNLTYEELLQRFDPILMFLVAWPLIGLAVMCCGWVEDIAAKRRPRLWPTGARRRGLSPPPAPLPAPATDG